MISITAGTAVAVGIIDAGIPGGVSEYCFFRNFHDRVEVSDGSSVVVVRQHSARIPRRTPQGFALNRGTRVAESVIPGLRILRILRQQKPPRTTFTFVAGGGGVCCFVLCRIVPVLRRNPTTTAHHHNRFTGGGR